MFGRSKPGAKGRTPNRLSEGAKPNTLSWAVTEPADTSPAEAVDDEGEEIEPAGWTIGRGGSRDYSRDASQVPASVRGPAGPAAADAVAALVMADVLEREDAETLYAPWAEVVGWPALPTYEDEPSDGA